ncbi:MAG TPA: archaetidylserine decarboxylase [Polyangiales bacterium]|nr:archaetidylserine decarboxylase [Polyangiales bacterium]
MTFSNLIRRSSDELHFVLTNRIPRRSWTRLMGWFSQIEQPLVRDLSIGVWRRFADLQLDEAAKSEFRSLHDCFTRQLKPGARPIDPDPGVLVSPCDGMVGGAGRIAGDQLIQAKGVSYTLEELLLDRQLAALYRDGCYVTLRLTASMYHRFHAPYDCQMEHLTYVAGDTWNTHPATLARVDKLYCKNERAILRTRLGSGHQVTLVPVAAILVASIRLHCLDVLLHLDHPGPNEFGLRADAKRGDELGWFQHGSTIILFAPRGFELCGGIEPGARVKMGERLLRLP